MFALQRVKDTTDQSHITSKPLDKKLSACWASRSNDQEETMSVVGKVFNAIDEHDLEALSELIHDDFVYFHYY